MRSWHHHVAWAGALLLLGVFSTQIAVPYMRETRYSAAAATEGPAAVALLPVLHVATPASVRAIYMTACVAATPSWREKLKVLIETTELNAVVIDIKDSTGTVSFASGIPETNSGKGCVVSDLKEFIESLHKSSIYVIGRISVFQDPSYAALHPELAVKSKASGGVWKDRKGLSFIDVGAKPYWDHIITLAEASHNIGFDELNFDYVRYPSDGNMDDAHFTWTTASSTKAMMLESFFSYLRSKLEGTGSVMSADLFGMTTTVASDMGIGQVLEKALPYFDYIAPMVYPSHYPAGWNGFANPAAHPYEVIKIAMAGGREREVALNIAQGLATSTPSKLRPWLQDFNLGATYGPTEVRAQMQATYDLGLNSWLLWSAGNVYTEAALQRP